MAQGNKYSCSTCGKTYEYCPKCAIIKPNYDAETFCCKEHAEIFAILSKHGCNLASAKETLAILKDYNTNGLAKDITAHINSLQPVKAETEEKEYEAPKKGFRKE